MPFHTAPSNRVASPPARTNLMILASGLWIGGAETVIRHLAQTIDRRLFNVTVAYLLERGEIGDELAAAGIDMVGISESSGNRVDYFTFIKVLKVIRARRIHVVHTHTTHGLVDASLCKLLRPGLRLVHTFHFGNYPHTRPRLMRMERLCSRAADRLFAVGEVQRRQIQSTYGFPDPRISTIWNGVPLPAGTGDHGFRARLGAGDRILIGTTATLIEQKGLRDLLKVARKVRDAGHDVRFVVVGEGDLRPELETLRHQLGLDDTVVFTGWVTSAAEHVVPTFDVFFQSSLWEAMSIAILEAMAAGRPVVATRVGENAAIIEDGVDGFLVRPGDVEGMTSALCRLIGDAGLRARLGDSARLKIRRRFSVEQMTQAYEQAYLDMLG